MSEPRGMMISEDVIATLPRHILIELLMVNKTEICKLETRIEIKLTKTTQTQHGKRIKRIKSENTTKHMTETITRA